MKLKFLDKFGAVGAFFSLIAAASCPACFPVFGVIGATLGLGFLKPYEGITMYVFQGFVALSLVGNIFSYLGHRKLYALVVGVLSPTLIFYAFYVSFSYALIYTGLFGLFVSAVINFAENRKCQSCKVDKNDNT